MRTEKYTAAFLTILAVASVQAEHWNRFRGPNGSGVSETNSIPTQWNTDQHRWEIELPGQGHSSPVAWGKKLFITSADVAKKTRYLHCLSPKDGRTLWQRDFGFQKYKKHKTNTFASNTPAVDEKHVYVLWQTREKSSLHALTHDGKEVWEVPLGPYKSGHGTGSSPIAHNGKVIVCNDHDAKNSFLVAFDAATGRELWKVPRIGDRACYSTPCIFSPGGRPAQVIFTHSFRGIWGVDLETGKVNWKKDVFGTHKQRAVGSPVVVGDIVIGSSGFTTAEKNVVALRPVKNDDAWTADEVYRVSKSAPHVPSPIVYRDRLYLVSDTGIVTCCNAQSGEKIWQKRIGGSFFSSPICVNGFIYAIDRDGTVTVLQAGDQFKRIGRVKLDAEVRATPAVIDNALIIRTLDKLIAVGQ